jgi:hypothetical protein
MKSPKEIRNKATNGGKKIKVSRNGPYLVYGKPRLTEQTITPDDEAIPTSGRLARNTN